MTIIHAISDLHGHKPELPGGDLLIIAGDCTAKDAVPEWIEFDKWCSNLIYQQIYIVPGNHDSYLQTNNCRLGRDWDLLIDEFVEWRGIKIYGSPWTPWFANVNPRCTAFMEMDYKLAEKFDKIPEGLDILVTHGPPHGILDGVRFGSVPLKKEIETKKPKYHIFGHIHEHGGETLIYTEDFLETSDENPARFPDRTIYCNVAYVDQFYKPHKNWQVCRIEI